MKQLDYDQKQNYVTTVCGREGNWKPVPWWSLCALGGTSNAPFNINFLYVSNIKALFIIICISPLLIYLTFDQTSEWEKMKQRGAKATQVLSGMF